MSPTIAKFVEEHVNILMCKSKQNFTNGLSSSIQIMVEVDILALSIDNPSQRNSSH